MTKSELIKMLDQYDDDAVIFVAKRERVYKSGGPYGGGYYPEDTVTIGSASSVEGYAYDQDTSIATALKIS